MRERDGDDNYFVFCLPLAAGRVVTVRTGVRRRPEERRLRRRDGRHRPRGPLRPLPAADADGLGLPEAERPRLVPQHSADVQVTTDARNRLGNDVNYLPRTDLAYR